MSIIRLGQTRSGYLSTGVCKSNLCYSIKYRDIHYHNTQESAIMPESVQTLSPTIKMATHDIGSLLI